MNSKIPAHSVPHFLIPGLVLTFLLMSNAIADIPVEGKVDLDVSYKITNIDDYQDHVFLTGSAIWKWEYVEIINRNGTFEGGYYQDDFVLGSAPVDKFDLQAFQADPQGYCTNNSYIVTSNTTLPVSKQLDEILDVERLDVDLMIVSITSTNLEISLTKATYHYKDGRLEEIPISGDQIPSP